MSKNLDVTIVGAGRYGKELIAPVYERNPRSILRGVISPTTSHEALAATALQDVPLFHTVQGWEKARGKATRSDLFDLAVHPRVLPGLVEDLAAIGAKNFIFPKPVAVSEENLGTLRMLKERHALSIVVASQWHYSGLTKRIQELIQEGKRKQALSRIRLDWRQALTGYTPASALLPHMLQIVYSCGLVSPTASLTVRSYSERHLDVVLSSDGVPIELFTDIQTPERKRTLEVFSEGKEAPILAADFLAVFKDGVAINPPNLFYDGKKEEFPEDILGKMTDEVVQAFLDNSIEKDSSILTFDRYVPVNELLLRILKTL